MRDPVPAGWRLGIELAVNHHESPRRNPGPRWGFAFLRAADRLLPRAIFRFFLVVGTGVALAAMPRQRASAIAYHRALTGKEPTLSQIWRQFFAFTESLMELLRLGQDGHHRFTIEESDEGNAFASLARSGRPALFGTFHVGNSDLLGYALHKFDRRVHMIRTRMENSDDTRWLGERFADGITFIWVDRPEAMLFAIKEAVEAGHSLAMKCDRPEQSGRLEAFRFLGKERLFPFAIYHFSLLFHMPVVFAMAWPLGIGRSEVTTSSVFEPDPQAGREGNFRRAREHFQEVLRDLEARLARDPALWFNFGPLNPENRPHPADLPSVP